MRKQMSLGERMDSLNLDGVKLTVVDQRMSVLFEHRLGIDGWEYLLLVASDSETLPVLSLLM